MNFRNGRQKGLFITTETARAPSMYTRFCRLIAAFSPTCGLLLLTAVRRRAIYKVKKMRVTRSILIGFDH